MRGSPRCLRSRLGLSQRQPRMVEKGAAGGGQFNAVHAAAHKLNTDLIFEITDLATERRLRRVEPFLRRQRQAALLGDRDEIAKVAQLHSGFHIFKACPSAYKVFFSGASGSHLCPTSKPESSRSITGSASGRTSRPSDRAP